jgi:hypothetical protein
MWCFIHRFMISDAADENRRPSSLTLRHIERCDSCRRFYENCFLMAAELKSDTDELSADSSGEYVQRFVADLIERPLKRERHVHFRLLAAAACIGLLFIGASVFVAVRHDRTTQHPSKTVVVQQIPAGDILDVLNRPLADPLSGEFNQITNEAESAVKFLAACVNVDITGNTPAKD